MAKPADRKPVANWKEIFIAALEKSPNVAAAARKAKISRQHAYAARKDDAGFAAAWDEALKLAIDNAEGEMWRRAVKGTLKPVFHRGKRCGTIREYSDTLLIFALKAHRPEKYRETIRSEHTGRDGGPIEYKDLTKLTDEELECIASGGSTGTTEAA